MNKTVIAISLAVLIGGGVFFALQYSSVEVSKDGVAVKVGAKEAEAGCFQDGPNCLPPLDYMDEDGTMWTAESLAGKVVIVNFWATWCKPCQSEVPDLAKIHTKYKDKDVVILGLMSDDPAKAKLEAFQKKYGLNYPVIRVTPEVAEAFGHPRALPTNFVYSRSGHLIYDTPGATSAAALEKEIKELL